MASLIHATAHGLVAGDPFRFANLVPADAGPIETTTYYVLAAGLTANAFEFSDTAGGTAFVLTHAVTDGSLVHIDQYAIRDDAVMSPPQDESGQVTQEPTGTVSAAAVQADFVSHGLYNGTFVDGIVGAVGLGRTSALPYWTVANTTGAPVLSFLSGGGVQCAFAAFGTKKTITSDVIKANGRTVNLEFGGLVTYYRAAGLAQLRVTFTLQNNTKADFSGSSTTGTHDSMVVGFGGSFSHVVHRLSTDPLGGPYFRLRIDIEETVAHDAGNYITIEEAWLRETPQVSSSFTVNDYLAGPGFESQDGVSVAMIVHGDLELEGGIVPGDLGRTTFPIDQPVGTVSYRTDLGMWFSWDGTNWVCTCPHTADVVPFDVQPPFPLTATSTNRWAAALPVSRGMDIVIDAYDVFFNVAGGGSALSGSHKWVATFASRPSSAALATLNINSGASNTYRSVASVGPDVVALTTTEVGVTLTWTLTGTPGDLRFSASIQYRFLVAP